MIFSLKVHLVIHPKSLLAKANFPKLGEGMASGEQRQIRSRPKDSEDKTSIILREICDDLSIEDLETFDN